MMEDENNHSKKKSKMKSSCTLESYFNKKGKTQVGSSSPLVGIQSLSENYPDTTAAPTRERECQYDINSLPHDPGKRKRILDYHPSDQDAVRREYIQRKACQPHDHDFPQTNFGGKLRRFNPDWFDKYIWLEYSIEKDAVFCFACYLFKDDVGILDGDGHDAFVKSGFRGWNRSLSLTKHVGKVKSVHNRCMEKFEALVNPKLSINNSFVRHTSHARKEYRTRLTASLECLKFLLLQGLAFRGHDESEESFNRGNFLELLKSYASKHEEIEKVVFKNAPGNNQMISPLIQKDLINSCSRETTKANVKELDDDHFAILVDESRDVSCKEQMTFCLRYVNKTGAVIERFVGVVHVKGTTALCLRDAIYSVLSEHSLSPSRIRGQGYDGASNMKSDINGLKTLIRNNTQAAYYIHCFAHQLQLTLVAVSKRNGDCGWLFETLSNMLNIVGGSCKRQEMLKEAQAEAIAKAFEDGELESGKGLNQELGLGRPGDTRWGSHYKLLVNVIVLYSPICKVLDMIYDNPQTPEDRAKADGVSYALESFDFILMVHLMKTIFGVTNQLNIALQKKDQDIVNAMSLVKLTKERLRQMREDGWESLLNSVISFCEKNGIDVPKMDDDYVPLGRKNRRRGKKDITYFHHYRFDVFVEIIDLQLQELDNRFDEVSTDLPLCMICLSPVDAFSSFDKSKLLRLAKFYPDEFSNVDLLCLEDELDNFVYDMRRYDRFHGLKDIGELSMKLVATKKHEIYCHVYLLIKMVLILPVATASVERAFSTLTYVKNKLRNSLGDQILNDCLVTYLERDVFLKISNDDILDRFQSMRTRRERL